MVEVSQSSFKDNEKLHKAIETPCKEIIILKNSKRYRGGFKYVIVDILETHCDEFRNCENYHTRVLFV